MAVDRRLRMVLLQGPEADVVEVIVSVTRGEIDRWEIVRDVRPPLADGRVDHGPGGAARPRRMECRTGPTWHRRQVAGADRPVAGRHVRTGPRGGTAHHPLPGLPAGVQGGQRLRPPARGPARLRRHGSGRGARGGRPRGRALPDGARELLPRAQRADANRPQAAGDRRSPRGRASRWTATWCVGRNGRCGSAWTHWKASCCGRSATRTAVVSVPSSTGPRSAKWWCRTDTRARCTHGRAPSTPANGVSVAWRTR